MCQQEQGGSGEKHIREIEKGGGRDESSGMGERKAAELYGQVCVMRPWVISQIASNPSALSVSHYIHSGDRRNDVKSVDVM